MQPDLFQELRWQQDAEGNRMWFDLDGALHREMGPAHVMANGDHYWLWHGLLHRTDGPAVELADGHQEWWVHGQRHREDGPAIVCADGFQSWYLKNNRISEQQFKRMTW